MQVKSVVRRFDLPFFYYNANHNIVNSQIASRIQATWPFWLCRILINRKRHGTCVSSRGARQIQNLKKGPALLRSFGVSSFFGKWISRCKAGTRFCPRILLRVQQIVLIILREPRFDCVPWYIKRCVYRESGMYECEECMPVTQTERVLPAQRRTRFLSSTANVFNDTNFLLYRKRALFSPFFFCGGCEPPTESEFEKTEIIC